MLGRLRVVPLLLLAASAPLGAQIEARQGVPGIDPAKKFRSPMILDIPAEALRTLPSRGSWKVPDVDQYVCEHVTITHLTVRKSVSRKGDVRLQITGKVVVANSFDRYVALRFDVVDQDAVLGSVSKAEIDAEEETTTPFRVELALQGPPAQRFAASPDLDLRLTVSLRRDGPPVPFHD